MQPMDPLRAVHSGETLSTIAERLSLDCSDFNRLFRANGGQELSQMAPGDDWIVWPGWRLRLPEPAHKE